MGDPQFSGQTERLSSPATPPASSRTRCTAASRCTSASVDIGEEDRATGDRARDASRLRPKADRAQENYPGPALPGKLADCASSDLYRLFLVEGDSAGNGARRARDKGLPGHPAAAQILNTWRSIPGQVLSSWEVHDLAVAIGCDDPGRTTCPACATTGGDPRRRGFRRAAHRDPAVGAVPAPLSRARAPGPRLRRDAPAVPRRRRQTGVLPRRVRTRRRTGRSSARRSAARSAITRFKGLGEMNPSQLRGSTIHPDTRRLVQLTVGDVADGDDGTAKLMDMLLCQKKRAADRKNGAGRRATWLRWKSDSRFGNVETAARPQAAVLRYSCDHDDVVAGHADRQVAMRRARSAATDRRHAHRGGRAPWRRSRRVSRCRDATTVTVAAGSAFRRSPGRPATRRRRSAHPSLRNWCSASHDQPTLVDAGFTAGEPAFAHREQAVRADEPADGTSGEVRRAPLITNGRAPGRAAGCAARPRAPVHWLRRSATACPRCRCLADTPRASVRAFAASIETAASAFSSSAPPFAATSGSACERSARAQTDDVRRRCRRL